MHLCVVPWPWPAWQRTQHLYPTEIIGVWLACGIRSAPSTGIQALTRQSARGRSHEEARGTPHREAQAEGGLPGGAQAGGLCAPTAACYWPASADGVAVHGLARGLPARSATSQTVKEAFAINSTTKSQTTRTAPWLQVLPALVGSLVLVIIGLVYWATRAPA